MNVKALLIPLMTFAVILPGTASAARDFVDHFDAAGTHADTKALEVWAAMTGDGEAEVDLAQGDGYATMTVDARGDRRGIWWALIKRSVSPFVDQKALARHDHELRVEARIRAHSAPHRINMSFNHSRTTDFHANLAEYDLADTEWHVVSLTTKDFDARPGDDIFVQLAMIDWGTDLYAIDIDYVGVEVVDPRKSGPDLGTPLPYRPAIPPLASFSNHLSVLEDAVVDSAYPWVNLRSWTDISDGDRSPALSVSGSQSTLLRWDLSRFRDRAPEGWGVLELTTESVQWAPTELEEFGYLRVAEILAGDPDWTRDEVTLESLLAGKAREQVFGQMFMDVPPAYERGGKTLVAVSPPVLQRLLSGRSKGIVVHAQGAVNASFYSSRAADEAKRPKLYFNLK